MRWYVGALMALLTGCTAVDVAQAPSARSGGGIFITSGDLNEPYESVGLLQVTRKGIRMFGVADFAGTDLNSGFQDVIQQVRMMGGHGIINVRWHQSQYPPVARFISIIILGMLPGEVTITGEVVRLRGSR